MKIKNIREQKAKRTERASGHTVKRNTPAAAKILTRIRKSGVITRKALKDIKRIGTQRKTYKATGKEELSGYILKYAEFINDNEVITRENAKELAARFKKEGRPLPLFYDYDLEDLYKCIGSINTIEADGQGLKFTGSLDDVINARRARDELQEGTAYLTFMLNEKDEREYLGGHKVYKLIAAEKIVGASIINRDTFTDEPEERKYFDIIAALKIIRKELDKI